MQRAVQRSRGKPNFTIGSGFDVLGDGVAVLLTFGEREENMKSGRRHAPTISTADVSAMHTVTNRAPGRRSRT